MVLCSTRVASCWSLSSNVLQSYGDFENSPANIELSGQNSAAFEVWPGTPPSEHSGEIGPEYITCLTANTSIPQCKDKSIHNVSVPTLTPFLVPNATSAMIIAP